MSVYARIDGVQERDPAKMYRRDFSVSLGSSCNLPAIRSRRATPVVRVVSSPDDE